MITRDQRPADTLIHIHADALSDGRLSFKARGILAYLLSMQPGHATTIERLAEHGTDGERAIKSGIKELQEHGYLPPGEIEHELLVTDMPGGVGPATPAEQPHHRQLEPLNRPADAPKMWEPGAQAMKTARNVVEIIDIELFTVEYLVRCKERNVFPSDSEWLRWLVKDERAEQQKQQQERRQNAKRASWYDVG